jgi:hypothetical protein
MSEQDVPPMVSRPAPAAAPTSSAETGVPPVPGVDDNSTPQGKFNPPPPPQ